MSRPCGPDVADVPDDQPPAQEMDAQFAAFLARHKDDFMRQATNRLRNVHDADEAVMDAALTMHRKWEVIQAHANPLALARAIVRTSCIDFYRSRARRTGRETLVHDGSYPTVPTADDLLQQRGYESLDLALEELGRRAPKQADCVRLRFLDDCELPEIAYELRISIGAVKSNISLGLKALEALMTMTVSERGEGES